MLSRSTVRNGRLAGGRLALAQLGFIAAALVAAAPAWAVDTDNDGLEDVGDPCPTDARNLCAGVVAIDATTTNPIRLNANVSAETCSGTKVDCNGDTWLGDFGYNEAASAATCNLAGGCAIDATPVFGCTDAATEDLFKCEHWDAAAAPELLYDFDVPDGSYVVNLLFMNSYTGSAAIGDRVFDVSIEGALVYDDLDQIVAAPGSGIPFVRAALVTVADGNGLQIEFGHNVENPTIKGIEVLTTTGCTIDAQCGDSNECTTDVCNAGVCENTAVVDGTTCDDTIACTAADTCQAGVCTAGTLDDLLCDDANACTDDTCDALLGCVAAANTDPCDDGVSCTVGDVCGAGVCGGADSCAPGESCNPGADLCEAFADVRINVNGALHVGTDYPGTWEADIGLGGACGANVYASTAPDIYGTVDDPLFQAEVYGSPLVCAVDRNGVAIPAGDYIVNLYFAEIYHGPGCPGDAGTIGSRVFDVELEGVSVETGIDIFAEAGCAASTTVITGTPIVRSYNVTINDGVLDINMPATADNAKISAIEILLAPECVVDIDCDDANVCTDEVCNAGVCEYTDNVLSCDDGDACSVGDVCSAGTCTAGAPLVCDDLNACTDDSCDPGLGCQVVDNTAPCDDGSLCTVGDVCGGGVCVSGGAANCDDTNECTDDSCDPGLGCQYADNTAPCDDGSLCTSADVCAGGACGGAAVDCNDTNDCTDDSCDPGLGCQYANNTAPCDDGSLCTSADVCAGGACGGAAVDCNDTNDCTDDSCDPGTGCINADNTAPCDDGTACTTGDVCAGGACDGAVLDCDDGDACTADSCDAVTGCGHEVIVGCAVDVPVSPTWGYMLTALLIATLGGLLAVNGRGSFGRRTRP